MPNQRLKEKDKDGGSDASGTWKSYGPMSRVTIWGKAYRRPFTTVECRVYVFFADSNNKRIFTQTLGVSASSRYPLYSRSEKNDDTISIPTEVRDEVDKVFLKVTAVESTGGIPTQTNDSEEYMQSLFDRMVRAIGTWTGRTSRPTQVPGFATAKFIKWGLPRS